MNMGAVPKNDQAFREYISTNGSEVLSGLGVGSVDDLFISSRDNKPYKMLYGKDVIRNDLGETIIGYEQEGKDGTRFVGFEGGVREMTEEEFRAVVKSP